MYRPNVKIIQERDYKGDLYYLWSVYDCDWVNQNVKEEGSSDSKEELQDDIAKAVGKVMLMSGSTYGLGIKQKER